MRFVNRLLNLSSLFSATLAYPVVPSQIPECPERGTALSQLARDSGCDVSNATALAFEVRTVPNSLVSPSSTTGIERRMIEVENMVVEGMVADEEQAASGGGDAASASGSLISEFGISPFFTSCGSSKALGAESAELDFSLGAPTTAKNLYRVLRALQVIFFNSGCLLLGRYGVKTCHG